VRRRWVKFLSGKWHRGQSRGLRRRRRKPCRRAIASSIRQDGLGQCNDVGTRGGRRRTTHPASLQRSTTTRTAPAAFRFDLQQVVLEHRITNGVAVNRRLLVMAQGGMRVQSARGACP
jgi:hypothetical protein